MYLIQTARAKVETQWKCHVAQSSELVPNELYTIDLSKLKIIVALLYSLIHLPPLIQKWSAKFLLPYLTQKQFSMFLLLR